MNRRFYVGNLPYSLTSDDLRRLSADYGQVEDAIVVRHYDTGESKGYGFVEMADDRGALVFANLMHGRIVRGRDMRVREATLRNPRPRLDRKDAA